MCEVQLSHTYPKGTYQAYAMRTHLAIKHASLNGGAEELKN